MFLSSFFFGLLLLSSGIVLSLAVDVNSVLYLYQITTPTGPGTTTTFGVASAAENVGNVYSAMNSVTGTANVTNPCDAGLALWQNSTSTNTYPCASEASCVVISPSVFRCTCSSGYNQTASTTSFNDPISTNSVTPDGTSCPDIDECATSTGSSCSPGTCVNAAGSYTCTCPSGYQFNAAGSPTCDDIDECTTPANNCDGNATCTNTNGSFTCTCKTDFTGSGTTCTDFDVCAHLGASACSGRGTCNDGLGSHSCACNSGYVENAATDPVSCDDVDECLSNPCDTNAICTNTVGSFTCACNNGYTGTGVTCSDVNECLASPCHADATCTNTAGSFTCSCNSPSVGNGFSCTGLIHSYEFRGQMVTQEDATGATVANRNSAIQTAIPSILDELVNSTTFGYNATGLSVTLEAVSGTSTNTNYIIIIIFVGVSDTSDELQARFNSLTIVTIINTKPIDSIGDYDECTINYGNCSTNATCANTNGSFTCTCQATHADKSSLTGLANGVVCDLPTSFNCTQGEISLETYAPYFTNLNIDVTTLTLGSCLGTTVGDYHTFTGQCDPVVSTTSTILTYSWNLTNINESATVVFGQFVNIPVQCNFPASLNVSLSINATRSEIEQPAIDIGVGVNVDFVVEPFFDVAFANRVNGPVTTNTAIFARIGSTQSLASNVKLVIESITAEASDNSNSVALVTGSCIAPNPTLPGLESLIGLISQGISSQAVAKVPALFFSSGSSTVYNFQVATCVESASSVCAPTCASGRRKRSTITLRIRHARDVLNSGSATFALVRAYDDKCTKDCGAGACVIDQVIQAEVCWCGTGTYKNNAGICVPANTPVQPNDNNITKTEDKTTLYVLIGLGCLVVVLITALALAFFYRKRNVSTKDYQLSRVNTHAIST